MPVPSTAADLSTTAGSNSPAGPDAIGTSLDDYLRSIQAIIKQQDSKGSDIASATTIDVPSSGKYFVVTGTTTIAGISDDWNGRVVVLKFSGALQLTHSSALILPGSANITTVAGDCLLVVNESTGVWRVVVYMRADGTSVTPVADESITSAKLEDQLLMGINDFRLTLTTAVPVTTSDVTGATTIYCTPYKGKRIALYDGTRWNVRTSAEFSLALGTLTSGKPYDVFCYDNAGTPTLEFLVWTDDTNRATALAYQDGVLVKSGAATRRYLGTFYTTSTTQTEDSATNRYLWNYYHRVRRVMRYVPTTDTWTYTTATIRQANNSASSQLNFLLGVAEDTVSATVQASLSNTNALVTVSALIGLDSTTAAASGSVIGNIQTPAAGARVSPRADYRGVPTAGRHFLAWLEYSQAVGTTTWEGDGGAPTVLQNGIVGEVFA